MRRDAEIHIETHKSHCYLVRTTAASSLRSTDGGRLSGLSKPVEPPPSSLSDYSRIPMKLARRVPLKNSKSWIGCVAWMTMIDSPVWTISSLDFRVLCRYRVVTKIVMRKRAKRKISSQAREEQEPVLYTYDYYVRTLAVTLYYTCRWVWHTEGIRRKKVEKLKKKMLITQAKPYQHRKHNDNNATRGSAPRACPLHASWTVTI